jgi:hypothetical protein
VTVADLFQGLVDDASVFPPGNLPLAPALAEHAEHRASWYRPFVGPLVLPASAVAEMAPGAPRVGLEVALTGRCGDPGLAQAVGRLSSEPGVSLRALEVAVPTDAGGTRFVDEVETVLTLAAGATGRPDVYVEPVPPTEAALDALASIRPGTYVKLRSGGVTADAFPGEETLAQWMAWCIGRGLPLKCTAGLHHAVRHTADETGFEHQGFLNVLLAVSCFVEGGEVPDAARVLSRRDAPAVAGEVSELAGPGAPPVRDVFRSFGSCSVLEPVEDLVALGLVAPQASASSHP